MNIAEIPLAELAIAAVLVLGTFLTLVAAIGLVRFPDIYCRMHAAGKAGTLGISLVILAAIIFFTIHGQGYRIPLAGFAAIFFQFLTTPAATHLLAKASYLRDYPLSDRTAVDELKAVLPAQPENETPGQE